MDDQNRKGNIAVLSASVNEHQGQLKWHLQKPIVQFFRKLYNESRGKAESLSRPGPYEDLVVFQSQLKLVPKWNQGTIDEIVTLILSWVRNKHFKVIQSIKTVVVARTMLMVAMGNANSEVSDKVRVDIPDTFSFMHNMLSLIANELFTYPSLFRVHKRDTESELMQKQNSVDKIIAEAIENTIIDQLSSPAVYTYLADSMNTDEFNRDEREEEEEEEESTPTVNDTFASNTTDSAAPDVGETFEEDEEEGGDEEEQEDEDDGESEPEMGFTKPSDTTTTEMVNVPAVATVVDNSNARVAKPIGSKTQAHDTFES
jgi:hypothetical protein